MQICVFSYIDSSNLTFASCILLQMLWLYLLVRIVYILLSRCLAFCANAKPWHCLRACSKWSPSHGMRGNGTALTQHCWRLHSGHHGVLQYFWWNTVRTPLWCNRTWRVVLYTFNMTLDHLFLNIHYMFTNERISLLLEKHSHMSLIRHKGFFDKLVTCLLGRG